MTKLDEIFSRIKAEPKTAEKSQSTNIDASKHYQVYNNSYVIICIILSATIITATSLHYNIKATVLREQNVPVRIISQQQADEISALVSIVSRCENKHYFDIYDDVRRISKALRYREMSADKFPIVKAMLENRVCKPK